MSTHGTAWCHEAAPTSPTGPPGMRLPGVSRWAGTLEMAMRDLARNT